MAAALPRAAHLCGALCTLTWECLSAFCILLVCKLALGHCGRHSTLPVLLLHALASSCLIPGLSALNRCCPLPICTCPSNAVPMQRVFRMLSMVELWLLLVSTFVMLYAHYLQVRRLRG